MSDLRWTATPDPIDETEQDGMSGSIPIGNVHRSGSGRWRWRIATLPTAGPIIREEMGATRAALAAVTAKRIGRPVRQHSTGEGQR